MWERLRRGDQGLSGRKRKILPLTLAKSCPQSSWHAPHLLDLEVTQVLRRLAQQGVVSGTRADEAIRDLLDLRVARYPHVVLLPRMWQLRHNFSAYDAAYIVLSEKLGAPLITRDSRLASASGHRAIIELF